MTESIEKVEERHTEGEMQTRDGETSIAVGLFLVALAIPVLIATIWALENFRGAVVNFVCGLVLLLIGGGATLYGWAELKRGKRNV